MKKRNFVLRGFTLAEVLITLVIIGVIGALTVPALIQNTQKQEYVSALKKAYSTLSQAANMIIAEEGSPKGDDSWHSSNDALYDMFRKYLNNAKDCRANKGCFPHGGRYKRLDGNMDTGADWDTSTYKKLMLADGSIIVFEPHRYPSCNGYSSNGCAQINIDLNGARKPNQFGRDYFAFILKENGLYPKGCDYENSCRQHGMDCTCKVLSEGAMNY